MNILAIDPGQKYTGIAIKSEEIYTTYEIQHIYAAWDYVCLIDWDLVICENFTAVQISTYGLATVRIIGGVEALCRDRNISYTHVQNFQRIKFKEQAKQMIIAAKGRMIRDHEQDALAHLLAWEHNATKSS